MNLFYNNNNNNNNKIIVIGGGIIGLTSAIELQENGWEVLIIAAEISPNTLSDNIAAFWEPYLSNPEEKVYKWAKDSLEKFQKIMKNDKNSGIKLIEGFDYSLNPNKLPKWINLLKYRICTPKELPKGILFGVYFESLMIEMQIFMPWLMNKFYNNGGKIEIKKLNNLVELINHPFQPYCIINCCGIGAYKLVNDKEIFPIRGQVVKIVPSNLCKKFYINENNDSLTYIFPRSDCIIIGGTAEIGEWEEKIDPNITKEMIKNAEFFVPGISKLPILKEFTGLRPGRTNIRIEKEIIFDKNQKKSIMIIHNYGHGGSGATLCWGCAKEVIYILNNYSHL